MLSYVKYQERNLFGSNISKGINRMMDILYTIEMNRRMHKKKRERREGEKEKKCTH